MSLTVIFFGITSLFADIAGEMLFPILPLFFVMEVGLSAAVLGVIEGLAEGSSNFFQVWFGWISDRIKRRKPFVILGYGTAAVGKFLLAISGSWPLILIARLFDRGGKGIRTSPRDALIAESISSDRQGAAFGLHRMLDSTGAVIGNTLAIVLVSIHMSLRNIVWLSLIPAFLAIFFILPVKEPKKIVVAGDTTMPKKVTMPSWSDFTSDRKKFGSEFWRFVWVSIIFHMGKISYAFLLLRLANLNVPTEQIPFYYLVFNMIQVIFAIPVGKFSDAFGKAVLVFASFLLFSLSSAGFIMGGSGLFLLSLFLIQGISFSLMEVGFRTFLVELSPHGLKATGLGIYFTVTGFAVMFASWIAGLLWQYNMGELTFIYSAAMTGMAALLFFFLFFKRIKGAILRLKLRM
ncbi:MAG: MFS transporter [Candidatus Peregrinibacteria bacterium]|nr:MFS transporter [Candidatus Peregrinibacteria bacterium]